jgi:Ubiquitin-2 like Rad60 SUMO-like
MNCMACCAGWQRGILQGKEDDTIEVRRGKGRQAGNCIWLRTWLCWDSCQGTGVQRYAVAARLCKWPAGETVQLLCHRKLMAAYCNKSSIDVESVAFIFDGQRIRGDQTPGDLDMEDQDEIEVSCCS